MEFSARWVEPAELTEWEPAWRRLVETAVDSSGFHEPHFLAAALRHLAGDADVRLLAIEAPKRVFPEGPRVLCGLLPIAVRRTFYGLPIRAWEVWKHDYSFLNTPLVRRDCAREVIDYLFAQAATRPDGAAVIHFPTIAAEGPFHRLLVESNAAARRTVFTKDHDTRALFRPAADAEAFLKANLSRKKRQGIQRTERRLAESGNLRCRWFAAGNDVQAWCGEFLRLEGAGWKGSAGSALASSEAHAAFFREMVAAAAADGRLMMGRLEFSGLPIAMICNLLSGHGGYSFKITYDESFAEHSPGLLLELALIRELHARGIAWMDSCAASDHSMINHLWPDRTLRHSIVVATGRRGGDFAASLMPLLQWTKNRLRRNRVPEKVPPKKSSLEKTPPQANDEGSRT
jgi:CelD/BcsL family acetyltransferase involved in cellulose biosynthesis